MMRWYEAVLLILGLCALAYLNSCSKPEDGDDGDKGESGEVGDVGPSGETGPAGQTGAGCVASKGADACVYIQCGESTTTVCDGATGATGERGVPGPRGDTGAAGSDGRDATEVTLVTPCPDTAATVPYPERFIRFADGSIVGFYSDPSWMYQRLVTLVRGVTYVTTDGRNCVFVAE